MTIAERLDNLEKLVYSYISSNDKKMKYKGYDIDGTRKGIEGNFDAIVTNSNDIADNRDGIVETFETTLVNTDDITDLRTAMEEIFELIIGEGE